MLEDEQIPRFDSPGSGGGRFEPLLDCHHALAPGLASPRFPEGGELLGDFRLLAELGRGHHGRVFLATQPMLSDRPVVLKLGPGIGEEHLSLARLQHSHIVPLYSSHEFPGSHLRALCLPYFGGATLAQLLSDLRDVAPGRRRGCDLLIALKQRGKSNQIAVSVDGPLCRFLERSSYVQAVCRIGASLARRRSTMPAKRGCSISISSHQMSYWQRTAGPCSSIFTLPDPHFRAALPLRPGWAGLRHTWPLNIGRRWPRSAKAGRSRPPSMPAPTFTHSDYSFMKRSREFFRN